MGTGTRGTGHGAHSGTSGTRRQRALWHVVGGIAMVHLGSCPVDPLGSVAAEIRPEIRLFSLSRHNIWNYDRFKSAFQDMCAGMFYKDIVLTH